MKYRYYWDPVKKCVMETDVYFPYKNDKIDYITLQLNFFENLFK